MLSPERIEQLQLAFTRTLAVFDVPVARAYPLFDQLVAAHEHPDRHYHNLEHLYEMFRVVGKLASHTTDLTAVQLAVWFHDAVYDPRAKDNEEQSAEFAAKSLSALNVPEPRIAIVQQLILATKHTDIAIVDANTEVLLDADLAILGASEERYRRYAKAIRQEYHFVAEADYRAGRTKVLEMFLTRPRVYRTHMMHEMGDEPARRNLREEITKLKSE